MATARLIVPTWCAFGRCLYWPIDLIFQEVPPPELSEFAREPRAEASSVRIADVANKSTPSQPQEVMVPAKPVEIVDFGKLLPDFSVVLRRAHISMNRVVDLKPRQTANLFAFRQEAAVILHVWNN